MSAPALRIGTRGSPLALAQARWVAELIRSSGSEVELVEIKTSGDLAQDSPAQPATQDPPFGGQDKSRWVDAIERALCDGEVDLAVHSAKDVPGELAQGLEIAGAPRRGDPRDVLVGAPSLAALPPGVRVGTGSLRRAAQLRALREDLEVTEVHGNVGTRLRKLSDQPALGAIVLARAGLERLHSPELGAPLDELVPAPGQGTLALEARCGDERVAQAIAKLRDPEAERALACERSLVRALEAGCHTPLGAHATIGSEGIRLRAFVGLPDGSAWLRDELQGADAEALGADVGERLLATGAAEMLGR